MGGGGGGGGYSVSEFVLIRVGKAIFLKQLKVFARPVCNQLTCALAISALYATGYSAGMYVCLVQGPCAIKSRLHAGQIRSLTLWGTSVYLCRLTSCTSLCLYCSDLERRVEQTRLTLFLSRTPMSRGLSVTAPPSWESERWGRYIYIHLYSMSA